MTVRKNAKHLTATERENLVRAFVLMHADIVNPGAPAADRYSRWDELVALHRMIQRTDTPFANDVNFGHGGTGAFGFLPWHRYFLLLVEQRLQSYVPGVALPYWDWTDPTVSLLTPGFLGPNGDPAANDEVRSGYFAADAPGTGTNPTPAPSWWPAGLAGWRLHAAFGTWAGPLKRRLRPVSQLPSIASVRSALDKTAYPAFQVALESGIGVSPAHGMHDSLHGWFGSTSTAAIAHMGSTRVSPFDPIFYLHHCNIDRLWAMWQMDGHATEYPTSGGDPGHHRNDPMYPWVGTATGYAPDSANTYPPITMPDFSAVGPVTAADVLDHRALGYSYDTQVVIGVSLDRTGSMSGLTPDPMTTTAPDVTKWEAAKRGVAAFLQDCETAYAGAQAYVVAGVETFRSIGANDFTQVFAGSPYGLVKPGGAYSAASFDAGVAGQSPGGGTPLADALLHADAQLVRPPFGTLPAGERRYLAMLTDGMLTSGAPLSSIPAGSLADTVVFAMGFGTGADVDYPTIAALVAKGRPVATQQVFHGENAGTIDKFYTQALAAALGFSPILDPVIELFEGEYAHLAYSATSADDAFFVTAQGLDFEDDAWGYQLVAPDGRVVLERNVPAGGHVHGGASHGHGGPLPSVASTYRNGRLSVFVDRDNADAATWVGPWTLLVSWRARMLDAMVMPEIGELLWPVSAGPSRGPRWSRLLADPCSRTAVRAVKGHEVRHRLDVGGLSTNRSGNEACSVVVNVFARTRLRTALRPRDGDRELRGKLAFDVEMEVLDGEATRVSGYARLVAPTRQVASANRRFATKPPQRGARLADAEDGRAFDSALLLAEAEAKDPRLAEPRDEEAHVVVHGGNPHVHVEGTSTPGTYHLGVYVEGTYCACCGDVRTESAEHGGHGDGGHRGHDDHGGHGGGHEHGGAATCRSHAPERFSRLLNATAAIPDPKIAPARRIEEKPPPRQRG